MMVPIDLQPMVAGSDNIRGKRYRHSVPQLYTDIQRPKIAMALHAVRV